MKRLSIILFALFATVSNADDKAISILNRLEKSGETNIRLKADIVFIENNPLTGDTQTRAGKVYFQNATTDKDNKTIQPKFRVSFETLQLGKKDATVNKVDYIFDGNWLTIAKHKIKSITKIQIAAKGEKVDALKIGKGPFPIPFGQKTSDITKLFEVATRKPIKSDPPKTDYLKMVPRLAHKKDINFTWLKMWIGVDNDLPVRIYSRDTNKNLTDVLFTKIETPKSFPESIFNMARPSGWDLTIERRK